MKPATASYGIAGVTVAALLTGTVYGAWAQSRPASKPSARAEAPIPAASSAPAARTAESTSAVSPLAAVDLIERLKSVRSEIVLEEEMIRLYKARVERMQLEGQLNAIEARSRPSDTPKPTIIVSAPKPRPEQDLIVRSVTTRPFKEAIVLYKGRTYTVRPGDKLGSIEIKDINESGVVTAGAGAVMVGR